jgi:hypothetical protein
VEPRSLAEQVLNSGAYIEEIPPIEELRVGTLHYFLGDVGEIQPGAPVAMEFIVDALARR